MGRRIARLAREHGVAERVLVGSRRPGEGGLRVDLGDPSSFAAFTGIDLLINAVGPFDYDPHPLVRACAEHGCHYVDIAETERFADAVRAEAEAAGSVVAVPGASTLPGTAEALAQRFAAHADVALVRALLGVGTANEASTTLIASMIGPIGRPIGASARRAFDTLLVREHRDLDRRVYGRYPSGADERGLVIDGARVPFELYFGLDRPLYTRSLSLVAPLMGAMPRAMIEKSASLVRPAVPLLRAVGKPVGVLRVEAVSQDGATLEAVEVRAAREGLDVPALPAVWMAEKIGRGSVPPGAWRVADLVSADETMARLRAAGLEVRVEAGEVL